jgi:hypothetical protein
MPTTNVVDATASAESRVKAGYVVRDQVGGRTGMTEAELNLLQRVM